MLSAQRELVRAFELEEMSMGPRRCQKQRDPAANWWYTKDREGCGKREQQESKAWSHRSVRAGKPET
jgi:hypothetical protein